MHTSLFYIYLIPLFFCILLALPYRFNEKTITRLSTLALMIPAIVSMILLSETLSTFALPYETKVTQFSVWGHIFPVIVWIDQYTIALLLLTHILGLLVVKYSHGYLHLEKGFQRYFSTILFFIFGMYLLCLAGTIDLFFAGWEVVGFSSFLLIAFYRDHTRSVQNAWRIYNIYRVCDLGLLLGAVMGHVLYHEATRFSVIQQLDPSSFTGVNSLSMICIAFFVILASLGKSAQFPFHNWPARAMEGPTPSSAIFYGALSIHAGVFLLIRTYSIWSHVTFGNILVGVIGFTTLIVSTIQERVQPNIKGQIAFASTAQIGLMFVELSFGLTNLVMFHLFCHALYRCFQLLVSPSIVFNSMELNNKVMQQRISKKDRAPSETMYVLAMSDFSMDVSWRGFNFLPWKRIYHMSLTILGQPFWVVPVLIGVVAICQRGMNIPLTLIVVATFFALRAMMLHYNAFMAMFDQTICLVLIMIAVYLTDSAYLTSVLSYMSSVGPCLLISLCICYKFKDYDLRNFHALGTKNTFLANIFMLCFLVIAGMPVSSAFMGEDEILEELIHHSVAMASLTTVCLTISGLLCVRLYTKLFMGKPVLNE